MMRVESIATVDEIKGEMIVGKTVVIFDVLRSSSTILAAFLAGVSEVIPVETLGKAFLLQNSETLLAGERYCKKISGFHFSNSPSELSSQSLQGKRLILSTTNGTRAIQKAMRGEHVLIGSFLNGSAVAQKVLQIGKELTLYCAGSRNEFAYEDGLAAGFLINKLFELSKDPLELSDFSQLLYDGYLQNINRIEEVLLKTATGKRLAQLGLTEDIRYSSRRDTIPLVPYLQEGRIFVHPETYSPTR
ncbi:putative 2-phosphosulfolactate phosphatase [[Clostridium] ultunense Esp]|nr:putative 2-phosphosulfolactate phosphatase [[Clostridium] ultunense Esp]